MRLRTGFILIVLLVVTSVYAVARQDSAASSGASEITLEGGFIGDVPFPHYLHQKNIGDCNACHQLFPQEKGAIGSFKEAGKLKNQQVMNSQCIGCHKENQTAGKPAGPTQCNKCHKRS